MYDIIIIGAGPAGLTAAIYARRNNNKTLVLESKTYGGQIINTLDIENYPTQEHISGYDFSTKLYNQAKSLGAEIIFEKATKINNYDDYKEVITSKNIYKTKTIIVATGAENRHLLIDREDELLGKGISYCATCDGAFYKNKVVGVVGGGNSALEDAIYLSNIVNKVYVIIRSDNFNAQDKNIQELKSKNNIEVIFNSRVTKLNGIDKLESIEITDNKENVSIIELSGLFVAIGRKPENEIVKDLIKLDDYGYIIAGENCHTNIDGIFVAGDNRTKDLRQLVTATSDGAISANEAIKYVNKD